MGVDIEAHLKSDPSSIDDDEYWVQLANQASADLLPDFQDAMWTGVQAGERAMGFAVSWDLMNEDVLSYTHQYAFDLIDPNGDMSIVAHTRQQVREAFVDWQLGKLGDRGFPDLVRTLEPTFGHMRANRIAATEATRLFAEGNLAAWRQGGVVTHKVWQTAMDDWVCPRCRPLHGKEVPMGQRFRDEVGGVDVDGPPLHVSCRCFLSGVVRGQEQPVKEEG
jgi:SPP1 gp7 family putative phage head morphogenesis protein